MTAVGNPFGFSWEVTLMEWLQTHSGSTGISVISFFSLFGEEHAHAVWHPAGHRPSRLFLLQECGLFHSDGSVDRFHGRHASDDRCVHFEVTRKPVWMAARLLGGLVVYYVVNTALKLPFTMEFLSDGSTAALLVRSARYAIIAFIDFGIYPMLFKFEKREDRQAAQSGVRFH